MMDQKDGHPICLFAVLSKRHGLFILHKWASTVWPISMMRSMCGQVCLCFQNWAATVMAFLDFHCNPIALESCFLYSTFNLFSFQFLVWPCSPAFAVIYPPVFLLLVCYWFSLSVVTYVTLFIYRFLFIIRSSSPSGCPSLIGAISVSLTTIHYMFDALILVHEIVTDSFAAISSLSFPFRSFIVTGFLCHFFFAVSFSSFICHHLLVPIYFRHFFIAFSSSQYLRLYSFVILSSSPSLRHCFCRPFFVSIFVAIFCRYFFVGASLSHISVAMFSLQCVYHQILVLRLHRGFFAAIFSSPSQYRHLSGATFCDGFWPPYPRHLLFITLLSSPLLFAVSSSTFLCHYFFVSI